VINYILVRVGFSREVVDTNAILLRSQTTKGIWIAKCVGIEPCTLVMDLEGTDGRERGEVIVILIQFLIFF